MESNNNKKENFKLLDINSLYYLQLTVFLKL